MFRVLFKKGHQRKFLNLVVKKLGCVSVRGILQFGFNIKYSTLKSYYIERRLIKKDLFEDLCHISKINPSDLHVIYIEDNYGQIKGGKKSKRK